MSAAHERVTDRTAACLDPSLLRVCDDVVTDLLERALDPSLVHPDLRVSLLAARQDGVVAWDQLIALGVSRTVIAGRVKRGTLRAQHVGVYLWGSPTPTGRGRVRAAVIAGRDGALASHHASVASWGLRGLPAGPVDVTTVGRRVRARGIRGHEATTLDRADRSVVDGIPVTAPARALLEVAPELTPRELADAVESAQVKRLVTKPQILAAIERAPGRAGIPALRALAVDEAFTRSRAERRLVALLRAARLPEPVFNAKIDGWEVDALWERERVVLEFDSHAFHATRAALERDRRKTAALTRRRYLVLRTTWTELTKQPYALIARSAEALVLSAGAPTASTARGGP